MAREDGRNAYLIAKISNQTGIYARKEVGEYIERKICRYVI